MANLATTNTLVTSVRRRMNLVGLSTISDAELKEFINDSLAQLYEILVSRWRDYYVSTFQISLVASTEAYTLPTDFRAASAVFLTSTANGTPPRRRQLQPFNMNEFNNRSLSSFTVDRSPIMYRIMGNSIYFSPVTTLPTTDKIELWYVPAYTKPATDDTTIGVGLPNGWELWVTLDVCSNVSARMRIPEFYQLFATERQRVEQRVIAAAAIRDETAPTMINMFDDDGGYFDGSNF